MVLVGSQSSSETLQGSVILTGNGLLDPESREEKVDTKEGLLAQRLCNSMAIGKDNANVSVLALPNQR